MQLLLVFWGVYPCTLFVATYPLIDLGRAVRKQINANPRLKVDRSINFSCIKLSFFTSYLLCNLSLVKLKTEGQAI